MNVRDAARQARALPLPFWVMFVDTFTMAVGFFMLIPLFAYHLLDNLAFSAGAVGVIAAVRSVSQQGMMIWSGSLADRIGYRRAICAGVLVRAVGFAVFGLVDSFGGFVVGSVLAGLGGSLFHPASYATYGVLTTPENRVTIYSIRELLSNAGFVLGPVIGGALLAVDFRFVCFTSAALFASTWVLSILGLPPLRSYASVRDAPRLWVTLRRVARHRDFVRFTWVVGGAWALVAQLYLAVPVRARDVLAASVSLGTVYSAGAIVMVVLMVPVSRLAERRLAPLRVLALGTAFLTAGLLVIGFTPVAVGLYLGVMVFTIGQVLSQPMMNGLVSRFAADGQMASYFGMNGLALAAGGLVGNVGGGVLYDLGTRPELAWLPWAAFAVWGAGATLLFLRSSSTIPPTGAAGGPPGDAQAA